MAVMTCSAMPAEVQAFKNANAVRERISLAELEFLFGNSSVISIIPPRMQLSLMDNAGE